MQQVRVRRTPNGIPEPDDFEVIAIADPEGDGVLAEVLSLSLDPYLRGRLSGRHLTGLIPVGAPMESELVMRLLEDAGSMVAGTLVRGFGPWQTRVRIVADQLTPVPDTGLKPSLALGVLGMPGLTAYAGVKRLLLPESGNTVVVSAAAGPVGATVGQLCKAAGARVVGIAGSAAKRDWLLNHANFDAVIDYKQGSLADGLDEHCPQGIDRYFDNVGGDVLDLVCERLAIGARVVLCGLMAQYNDAAPRPGPAVGLFIRARATVCGLVVYDHEDLREEMHHALTAMIADGSLAYLEEAHSGLDQAPAAFARLMAGANFGKVIVDLA